MVKTMNSRCFVMEYSLGLWSGQTQQTVNLSAFAFVGSNPTPSTKVKSHSSDGFLLWSMMLLVLEAEPTLQLGGLGGFV